MEDEDERILRLLAERAGLTLALAQFPEDVANAYAQAKARSQAMPTYDSADIAFGLDVYTEAVAWAPEWKEPQE